MILDEAAVIEIKRLKKVIRDKNIIILVMMSIVFLTLITGIIQAWRQSHKIDKTLMTVAEGQTKKKLGNRKIKNRKRKKNLDIL